MKQLLLLSFLFLLLLGCGNSAGKFGNPQATFDTLQEAIKNKDMALYKECWDPERMEREGSVTQLEEKPGLWEELQGIFKGPQKLNEETSSSDDQGREKKKFKVDAPEAEDGGIGVLTMVKIGEEWKMYSW